MSVYVCAHLSEICQLCASMSIKKMVTHHTTHYTCTSLSLSLSIGSLYDVMTAVEQCSQHRTGINITVTYVYNACVCVRVCDVGEGRHGIASALIALCTSWTNSTTN